MTVALTDEIVYDKCYCKSSCINIIMESRQICVNMFFIVLIMSVTYTVGQSTGSSSNSNSTSIGGILSYANARAFPTMYVQNVSFSYEPGEQEIGKSDVFREFPSSPKETQTMLLDSDAALTTNAFTVSPDEKFGDPEEGTVQSIESGETSKKTTSIETPMTTTTFWDSKVVSTTSAFTISPAEDHNDFPITSDPKEDMFATWIPGDATTISDKPREETTSTSTIENLSKRDTVTNCFCDVDQLLVDGNCVPAEGGTFVIMHVSRTNHKIILAPMADKKAIIRDLVCDTESRELTFSKGQFRLRDRGDIVLMESAGELNGLRTGSYCISHYLDDHENLTWTAKVCVEPPRVPRCCPPGKTMKNNVCLRSRTPEILEPPISADPYGSAVSWQTIKNYVKPLTCTSEPMKDIPLKPGESYLMAHTDGLVHVWISEETEYKSEFSFDHKYCVDGRQNLDGSTSYSVKMCFESPIEHHHRMCGNNVCVRKCCQFGEILDTYLHRCVPRESEFAPHMNTDYKIVVGYPLSGPTTLVANFSLSPDTGYLSTWNETLPTKWNITLPPTDYCLDTFSDREGRLTIGALAKLLSHQVSWWERTKTMVFSSCMLTSLIFLLLIVVCYATVPVLLANTGKSHLCHVLSLIIAFSCDVTLYFLNKVIGVPACIALGITMQFGYLSAFFWLSVLCFDVWRLFKSLESKLRPPTPFPPYAYHIYAWGGPLVICSATLILQFADLDHIPWLIKPNLGYRKCWFNPNMEAFVFFYLYIAVLLFANCIFIAHTYWIKRKMDRSLSAVRGDKNENGAKRATESTFRTRDAYSEFITKFLLLALISTCWVTEVLSWKVPPMDLWTVTDLINTLQGFFIFVIFLQDRRKRKHIREKFPKMFGFFESILQVLKPKNAMPCPHLAKGTFSPSTYISTLNRKLSSSSLVSNLSTLSSSLKLSSTSSLEIGTKANTVQRSKSVDENNGIISLSFTQIIPQMGSDSFSSSSSI